jgi:cell cycle arrest protein BUB2
VWPGYHLPGLCVCSMSYVQGMNILVAPFLFVMPELDSYHSFTTMLQELCPL